MKKALLMLSTVVFFAAFSIFPALAAAVSLPITQSVATPAGGKPASVTVTYTLTAKTSDAPMPTGSVNGTYTVSVTDRGSVTLPGIAPDCAGSWEYDLTASASGGSVTPTRVHLKLTAWDGADGLETDMICKTDGGEKTDLAFTVTPPGVVPTPTPTPSTHGTTPKTGDETHVRLFEILAVGSGSILLLALLLSRREKRCTKQ